MSLVGKLDEFADNGVVEFRLPSGRLWTGDKRGGVIFPHYDDDGHPPRECQAAIVASEVKWRLPIEAVKNAIREED